MEYRLVHRIIKHNDFRDGPFVFVVFRFFLSFQSKFFTFRSFAGVSAVLVRKDNKPKWNPSKIKDVTDEQISYFFGPFANGDELPM